MHVLKSTRTSLLAVAIFALGAAGIQTASADQLESGNNYLKSDNQIPQPPTTDISSELKQEKESHGLIDNVPQVTSMTANPVVAASVVDVLKWVCKTTLTVVGVGAWVTSVYSSGGVLFTTATWVVRYVTIPALVCNWL